MMVRFLRPRRPQHLLVHGASQVSLQQCREVAVITADVAHVAGSSQLVTLSQLTASRDAGHTELRCYVFLMKLKGTIRRNDLEGGHWVIETDKGETYQLTGELGDARDGMQYELEGKVDKGAMGIGMTGPHFTVQKLTAVRTKGDAKSAPN